MLEGKGGRGGRGKGGRRRVQEGEAVFKKKDESNKKLFGVFTLNTLSVSPTTELGIGGNCQLT